MKINENLRKSMKININPGLGRSRHPNLVLPSPNVEFWRPPTSIFSIRARRQRRQPVNIQISDFNLSGGCFGTDIIQKCTKWSQVGVHGLKIWPIFAKFQCASFSIRKNVEKWQYGRTKHKNVVFREKKSLRSYTGHTKVGKRKNSDIIYLNWISLINLN
jgi:hypothetical protein